MPNEQWAPLTLARVTSTPSDVQEGSIWYRTDTDEVHASDGNSGTPVMLRGGTNVPVVRTNAWHTLPPTGAPATANVPASRMFAVPFWPGRRCTITAIAANVTLALVGGNLRMGIYSSDGVLPTTLLADFGTVSSGVTGVRQITGLSTAVRPVLHYLVVGRQGGVLNLGLTTRDTWDPIISETVPVIAGSLNSYFIDSVAGALPNSFGAPGGSDTGPAVAVQLT
jgi:hypothetical protein